MEKELKKTYGQFFTTTNPFYHNAFFKWFKAIPNIENEILLEPFAGSNNICEMIKNLGFMNEWKCFDISPSNLNKTPEYKIEKRDTIADYPKGYNVAITNPPYLAKNSATRSGKAFPDTEYDDLYKLALEVMLKNTMYVAAIIPESFITADIFHDRLDVFISLTCKMFDDTDCPVCLALFSPKQNLTHLKNDFIIYQQNRKIGTYNKILSRKPEAPVNNHWKFNDEDGNIGIRCIDGIFEPSICFCFGEEIDKKKIKVSSRALTRVSGLPKDIGLEEFINECNDILNRYRIDTYDIFLTSFKGLRKDGKYRRRLDFKNAKIIMDVAVSNIKQRRTAK